MVRHCVGVGFNEDFESEHSIQILRDNIKNAKKITIGDVHFFVVRIDEHIQIWYKTEIVEETILINTCTVHYDTEKTQKIINPEWVYEDEDIAILQVAFEEDSYHLNVEIIDKRIGEEIDCNREYYCQIVCFAEEVELFKTEKAFREQHGKMGTQSVIPTGTFSLNGEDEVQTAHIWINGIVRKADRKVNSYTGKGYYHLVVESYGAEFDILVAEDLLDVQVEVNDLISAVCWLSGRVGNEVKGNGYYNYVTSESMTAEDFIELIEKPMKSLQDKPGEHIVVNFEQPEKMGNITFIQSARYGKKYLVEVGKTANEKHSLYRLDELDLGQAIQIFEEVCVLKKIPDLSAWEDMTSKILGK